MGLPNQNMNLVLSTDAKPRLKWTVELHQRFVEAVNQLGGAGKATPKSLMRLMGIPGLTLYHLKSHLQKYRLGKSQQSESCINIKQIDYKEVHSGDWHFGKELNDGTDNQINESLQIAQALQVQMEVQRKLHEQIEVQRHLQLRIEAQGKYLQTVLKKAQETLSGYNSSSAEVELAKAELSQLVTMVNSGCPSSSISDLTEAGGSGLKDMDRKQIRSRICSMESSLTSSESSGTKEEKNPKSECHDTIKSNSTIELSLMDMHKEDELSEVKANTSSAGKRNASTIMSSSDCVEQSSIRGSSSNIGGSNKMRKLGIVEMLDLNRQYQNDIDPGPKAIDLNCRVIELNEHQ